jgi:hypothetical protein
MYAYCVWGLAGYCVIGAGVPPRLS